MFLCVVRVFGDYLDSKQKAKQYTENLSAKLQNFPGLAKSASEERDLGATLLGRPKSIYYFCNTEGHLFGELRSR